MNYHEAIEYLDLRADERGAVALSTIELAVTDLRTMLGELVSAVESCETYGDFSLLIGKTVQQAHAILAKTEKEEIK